MSELKKCPYCGSTMYENRCLFYLCEGDSRYRVRLESARAQELADEMGISYEEACEMRERWDAKP